MSELLITAEPKLLPVPVSFTIPGGYLLIGDIDYVARIEYLEHDQNFTSSINGTIPSTGLDDYNFNFDFGNIIIGGAFNCDLGLPVQEIASGAQSTYPINIQADITGMNPAKNDIRILLPDIALQVIAYKESRFLQFKSDGTPFWGPPHGFGIMQVDPPNNEEEVFNWQANITEGISRFNQKKQTAASYPAEIRLSFPDAADFNGDQLKLEAYQLYNGGHYWSWDDLNKVWTKNPNANGYADDALRIENLVINGNPPADW